jgi:hypothetical protein
MFDHSTGDPVVKALTTMGRGLPIMTIKEFARLSGMTEDSVRKSIQRGYLPTFKLGQGRIFVNVARLTLDALGIELDKPVSVPVSPPPVPVTPKLKRRRKR